MVLTDLRIDLTVLQGAAIDQRRIDGVPAQPRPVVVGGQVVFQGPFREPVILPTRGGRQKPTVDSPQIDGALRTLEVVNVGCALVAHSPAVTRNEISPFGADVEGRFGRGAVKRQTVDEFSQQAAFRLP